MGFQVCLPLVSSSFLLSFFPYHLSLHTGTLTVVIQERAGEVALYKRKLALEALQVCYFELVTFEAGILLSNKLAKLGQTSGPSTAK